ncbi:putative membrane protein [Volucribacter psittacicida]|uniref:UPF0283 membrane protein EV694_1084 n=1 Tax=Volucribacter psittacicida TaxID=203482 RepID=A0A4R1FWN7_9PAST|nr:TIGR01620 family protein [Volucribacter psittacicida]TCJ98670.1 putative membrane protein [Volucribacter psittacicida]
MSKQIFSQVEQSPQHNEETENIQQKQIFTTEDIQIDPSALNSATLEGERVEDKFEQMLQPKPRWWKKLLATGLILFIGAVIAQTIQWLIDSWQQNQWIYLVFAIASLALIVVGLNAIVQEWRTLVRLKRRMRYQQQGETLLQQSSQQDDSEKGKAFCFGLVENMGLDKQDPRLIQWQQQINEAHSAQEVSYLFSQNVLADLDRQAKKAISQSATEATLIVAISPLALVDMFFVAWRNLGLINKIAKIYGIELGYFSRIRLLRMVLVNIAFAGATELVQEMGMDWLSQDITAKLSARMAQGIGVGLLTARLGIKAMAFCRPMPFQSGEKPRLSLVHKQLLTTLKDNLLKTKQHQPKQSEYR